MFRRVSKVTFSWFVWRCCLISPVVVFYCVESVGKISDASKWLWMFLGKMEPMIKATYDSRYMCVFMPQGRRSRWVNVRVIWGSVRKKEKSKKPEKCNVTQSIFIWGFGVCASWGEIKSVVMVPPFWKSPAPWILAMNRKDDDCEVQLEPVPLKVIVQLIPGLLEWARRESQFCGL